ncbi:MAG: SDR family oxidoreductase [Saprospiraceae bacterium]|nr:SDR family oxidoreductase [Saprospiraceae bacterium]
MLKIDLSGMHALVCGSSKGIGKAIAIVLAESGASVTMLARNEELLLNNLKILSKNNSQNHAILVADMSNPILLDPVIQKISAANKVNILVNNTGGPPAGKLYNATLSELEAAFHQHLSCNHLLMQAVLPSMKDNHYGRIINIISTSVKQPLDNLGVSNSIRAAVASWSKTLANELAEWNITVNNVLPGATETERLSTIVQKEMQLHSKTEEEVKKSMMSQIPLKRFGKPEELAYAVAFLASPLASYINGINLPVDGGRTKSL